MGKYRFLVVLSAAVLLAGCGSSSSKSAAPTPAAPTSSSTSTSVAVTTSTVSIPAGPTGAAALAEACKGCKLTDTETGLTAPGNVGATAVIGANDGSYDLYIVDANRKVLYSAPTAGDNAGIPGSLVPKFQKDKSGNVLAAFAQGAHSGIIYAISVTPNGVNDFGSKSTKQDTSGKFFGLSAPDLKDVDNDGLLELVVGTNNYEPDYASGTSLVTTYHWNGTTYAASSCAKTPANGKTVTSAPPANGTCTF